MKRRSPIIVNVPHSSTFIPEEERRFFAAEKLLEKYYDTYHKTLELAVEERLGQFGYCFIVDGHSFPESPLPYEYDRNPYRPDICIGTDDYHTPGEVTESLKNIFEKMGFSVAVNEPFAGALVPMRYYQNDKRVMSVMIEINRRLYINRQGEITDGYEWVKEAVSRVITELSKMHVL